MDMQAIQVNWSIRDAQLYIARKPETKYLELHIRHVDSLLPKLGGTELASLRAYRAVLLTEWASRNS